MGHDSVTRRVARRQPAFDSSSCGDASARRRTSLIMCASSWKPNAAAVAPSSRPARRPAAPASGRSGRAAWGRGRWQRAPGGGTAARCSRTPAPAPGCRRRAARPPPAGPGARRRARPRRATAAADDIGEREPYVGELTRGDAVERGEGAGPEPDAVRALAGAQLRVDRAGQRADEVATDEVGAAVRDHPQGGVAVGGEVPDVGDERRESDAAAAARASAPRRRPGR